MLVDAVKAQEKLIDFSKWLHPTNEQDQKEAFLRGKIENPIFKYQLINIPNFIPLNVAVDDPIDQLYKDRIQFTEGLTSLLQAIGDDEKFSRISQEVFPYKDLDYQISIEEKSDNNKIDAEEIRKRFLKELKDLNIEGWTVEIVDNISSRMMVSYPEKAIRIKKGISINNKELEELTHHEIGVHVLRSANGRIQTEPLLHIGTVAGRFFEEGVACFLENPEGPYRIFLRHFAVKIAQNSSFRETYNLLIEKGLSQNEAWSMTLRVKRGLTDTSKLGGFTRDAIYAQAFSEMKEYMKDGGELSLILSAPIHPREIDFLTKHARLRKIC